MDDSNSIKMNVYIHVLLSLFDKSPKDYVYWKEVQYGIKWIKFKLTRDDIMLGWGIVIGKYQHLTYNHCIFYGDLSKNLILFNEIILM